ncbi:MAG: extracellular solute-binding protein [Rhodospirillales bacterium]|nr:extracellular solute-binding protein [Rhodospirillales bacterium]
MTTTFGSRRLAAIAAIAAFTLASTADARELILYTASNPKIEVDIMAAFQKKYPDIKLKNINQSTGPIVQRIIAEKANPQADVAWMLNDIALEQLKQAGVLEPHQPKDSPVAKEFRDPDGFYMGHNATVMAMAVNTKLLKEKNLPMPVTWEDLIKPVYKGQITVASPTKSGTGLSIFATMLDAFGWNFIDNLHQNIFQYGTSGSTPARQAGTGEVAIGLSYDIAVLQQKDAGLPVDMVIGRISPNVIEGAGLIAKAPNPKEAKLFMDWLFSAEGAKVFAPHIGIGAVPGTGIVDVSKVHLWKMRRPLDSDDFKRQWAAKYEK